MLNESKRDIALQGMTTLARKVYEAVPIEEAWSSASIGAEMSRIGGTVPSLSVLEGCLKALIEGDLVRRIGRSKYQRAPVRVRVETQSETPEPTIEPEETPVPKPKTAEESATDHLGQLAAQARGMAQELLNLADRIDAAALDVVQAIEAARKGDEKLRALRELLKEI